MNNDTYPLTYDTRQSYILNEDNQTDIKYGKMPFFENIIGTNNLPIENLAINLAELKYLGNLYQRIKQIQKDRNEIKEKVISTSTEFNLLSR